MLEISSTNEIQEVWKDAAGYEGFYQVSNLGNVKSCERFVKHPRGGNKLLKSKDMRLNNDTHGYKVVSLCKEGRENTIKVHRLVANAFIENVDNKLQVNHINGVKFDNNVFNLEWATPSENLKHAHSTGLKKTSVNNERAVLAFDKLTNELVSNFVSISKASRELNISKCDVSAVLNNRQKTAKGYYFKYKN
jgi:hypothetical protein